jgi:hypothetical protein
MKKLFSSILIMIFAITLTACSSLSTATTASSKSTDLPIETQLAVGTLKLAGTDQDVTADQAEDLVVYWQVYEELSQSDTAAQVEIDALVAQIRETMTTDQMQAITDMKITQQDVLASMQGATVTSSNSSGSTVSVPSGSSSGGGMPAGGPPADGGGMLLDMGGSVPASSAGQTQSTQTRSGASVTANVPTALVEVVIQSLQQKIAG